MRRGLVVGGAGLAFFAVLMVGCDGAPEAAATRRPVRGATARASVANDPAVVDLRLHRLRITPGASESVERNLFRFESAPSSTASADARCTPGAVLRRVRSQSRSGRRPFPPIPLKLHRAAGSAGARRAASPSSAMGEETYSTDEKAILSRAATACFKSAQSPPSCRTSTAAVGRPSACQDNDAPHFFGCSHCSSSPPSSRDAALVGRMAKARVRPVPAIGMPRSSTSAAPFRRIRTAPTTVSHSSAP